jgi:hypothetical protein
MIRSKYTRKSVWTNSCAVVTASASSIVRTLTRGPVAS